MSKPRARKSESARGGSHWAAAAGLRRVEVTLTPEEYAAGAKGAEQTGQSLAGFVKSQFLSSKRVKTILENLSKSH